MHTLIALLLIASNNNSVHRLPHVSETHDRHMQTLIWQNRESLGLNPYCFKNHVYEPDIGLDDLDCGNDLDIALDCAASKRYLIDNSFRPEKFESCVQYLRENPEAQL